MASVQVWPLTPHDPSGLSQLIPAEDLNLISLPILAIHYEAASRIGKCTSEARVAPFVGQLLMR